MKNTIPRFSLLVTLCLPWTATSQWIQTNGPSGTYVQAFAISGTEVFLAARGGGVQRSTDIGLSWTEANGGLDNREVYALAVIDSHLFAGTWGGGVYRSVDKGSSWNATGLAYVQALAVSGTTLFAGTYNDGVFRSTDNAATWYEVNVGLNNYKVFALAASGASLFAGTQTGVYRSTDDGENWTKTSTGLPPTSARAFVVAGTNIFASLSGVGVFKSTDNGEIWFPSYGGLDALHRVSVLALCGAYLYAGTEGSGGIFRSMNYGTSWSEVNTGLGSRNVLAITAYGSTIFAGTDNCGVYRSTDYGASWSATNVGLRTSVITALDATDRDLLIGTYGTDGAVHRSVNDGEGWIPWDLPRTTVWSLTNVFDQFVRVRYTYAGTLGGANRTSDRGGTWTGVTGLSGKDVHCFLEKGPNLFAGTFGSGVYRSSDDGATWTESSPGLADPDISALVTVGDDIFAGTFGGGIYRSIDDGVTWSPVPTGFDPYVQALGSIGTTLYAGTWRLGMFRSTDSGATWTELNDGLESWDIHALKVYGPHLFVGTYAGVALLTAGSTTWQAINTNLSNLYVWSLAVGDSFVYAGTTGGLWERPISQVITSVHPASGGIPSGFILAQNYPNPFNPGTTIEFGVPERCRVKLSVYDLTGREVATLVDGLEEPGYRVVGFDGGNLASGIYYYRLKSDKFIGTKKLLLMR